MAKKRTKNNDLGDNGVLEMKIQVEISTGTYTVFCKMIDSTTVDVNAQLVGAYDIDRVEKDGANVHEELMSNEIMMREVLNAFTNKVAQIQ